MTDRRSSGSAAERGRPCFTQLLWNEAVSVYCEPQCLFTTPVSVNWRFLGAREFFLNWPFLQTSSHETFTPESSGSTQRLLRRNRENETMWDEGKSNDACEISRFEIQIGCGLRREMCESTRGSRSVNQLRFAVKREPEKSN